MLRLGITEMYRVAKQLYDPYLPSYAYGNYWPVKIRHYCNRETQRKIFPRKELNDCSIDLYNQIIKRLTIHFAVEYLFFNNNCVLNGPYLFVRGLII